MSGCGEIAEYPTIRRGDRGSAVAHAQCLLNHNHGKALDVDGIFGKKTERAVKQVQRDCGLGVDGIVGPKTWKALRYGC